MGATALRESLDEHFPAFKRIFIYSSLNNKDYKQVIKTLFRKEDRVILTRNSSLACEEPEVLKQHFTEQSEVFTTQNVEEAVNLSKNITEKDDLTIFTGSIYTIGEFFSIKNGLINFVK